MPEMVRCPNCVAPLRLDAGPVVTCRYCEAQCRLDAPSAVVAPSTPGHARLAEAISFVTPTNTIPWLEKGSALPIHRTQTLSTRTDDQDTLNVNLVQGSEKLVELQFPIQKRAPRGVPKLALTVRVATDGSMSVTVTEAGTPNAIDREAIRVRVT
jgi:hypothetical protein